MRHVFLVLCLILTGCGGGSAKDTKEQPAGKAIVGTKGIFALTEKEMRALLAITQDEARSKFGPPDDIQATEGFSLWTYSSNQAYHPRWLQFQGERCVDVSEAMKPK